MVAAAKFHLSLAGIVGPVTLKLCMGLMRMFREEALYATRLFFFRLGQIAFNRETPLANGGGTRLERALRLIGQTVSTTNNSTATTPSEDDTLNTLSMLAL